MSTLVLATTLLLSDSVVYLVHDLYMLPSFEIFEMFANAEMLTQEMKKTRQ